jgi:hypothetical protein
MPAWHASTKKPLISYFVAKHFFFVAKRHVFATKKICSQNKIKSELARDLTGDIIALNAIVAKNKHHQRDQSKKKMLS